MDKIFKLDLKIAFLIFVLIDLICIGMGMGVPIFCVLFGFLVGWYISRRITLSREGDLAGNLRKILRYAILTSLFTFVMMCILWGRTVKLLFKPDTDFVNFGTPLILYDPKLSFIGWLVLMIFISPFLQLLTTIFTSHLTLLKWSREISAAYEQGQVSRENLISEVVQEGFGISDIFVDPERVGLR